jgi:hypothetical protein
MTKVSVSRVFWLCITSLLAACSSDPIAPPPLIFEITSNYQTNNNRLFYFVVRNANEKQFMLENYTEIANKAFIEPPDPITLGVFSIIPGTTQEYSVNLPAQGNIALYFLLTEPTPQWKELLTSPLEEKYNIELKANNQIEIKQNKGWFSWF